MSTTRDWVPSGRAKVLIMAHMWITVFIEEITDSKGQKVRKHIFWGIPVEIFNELGMLYAAAQDALTAAIEKGTRTEVTNAACKDAFDALIACMRYIKKRWLHIKPLSNADYVSLGFTLPDDSRMPSETPTAQIIAELYLTKGRHELGVRARYIKGSPGERANKGYEYKYIIKAPGEKAPESPSELTELFDTQRMNDVILFEYGASGKIVYVSARVKNGKRKGPWGPIVSALIP